jgi:uncharacterized protein (TIGR02118 family)
MIKLSVLYPNGAGKHFNIDYYCEMHIPLVSRLLGQSLKGVAVEHGISGEQPGSPPPYLAMGHLLFDSLEDFQSSFGKHAEKIVADVPNYTNVEPVLQISQVRV